MRPTPPSRTAREAAVHRAMHQELDGGTILRDPLAYLILDDEGRKAAAAKLCDPASREIRLYLAARSRFAEDSLSAAVQRGVRQVVILGAGLDTFGLRNPYARLGLRVFEVDQLATQAWKRERLAEAGLAIPVSLSFVPADFEQDDLANKLAAGEFQLSQPAFFIWLGVVSYLTREAIVETLSIVARVPGAEIVFDYGEPFENYAPAERARVEALAAWVAGGGEPWLSLFDPAALASELRAFGFSEAEDLSHRELAERFFSDMAADVKIGPGVHVIRARQLT